MTSTSRPPASHHRHHRPGRQAHGAGRPGHSAATSSTRSAGTNLVQPAGASRRQGHADRQHRQPGRRRRGRGGGLDDRDLHRHRQRRGRRAGRRARWSSCVPGGGEVALIGGIAGDVDQRRPPRRASPGRRAASSTSSRPSRRTGTAQKALNRRRRPACAPTPTSRASSPPTTTWRWASPAPSQNAGKNGQVEDHQRRRHQGRAEGGQGRRAVRDRRAVPLRDRRRWASRPAAAARRARTCPTTSRRRSQLVTKDNVDDGAGELPRRRSRPTTTRSPRDRELTMTTTSSRHDGSRPSGRRRHRASDAPQRRS